MISTGGQPFLKRNGEGKDWVVGIKEVAERDMEEKGGGQLHLGCKIKKSI